MNLAWALEQCRGAPTCWRWRAGSTASRTRRTGGWPGWARSCSRAAPARSRTATPARSPPAATGRPAGCCARLGSSGRLAEVWVDETRPLLQGARLTAWELRQAGIPHRVVADSAAGSLMARGLVDRVVVGADRIAANGDVANKVGTYPLAVLAAAPRRAVLRGGAAVDDRSGHARRRARYRSRSATRRGAGGRRGVQSGVRRDAGGAGHGDRHRGRCAGAALLRSRSPGHWRRARDRRGPLLSRSRRPLVLGIGGGGDVVGALATAEACRLHGAEPVVGGVTWERRPIDPQPGPRAEAEIEGARRLAPGVLAASAGTRVRESGVLFAESRMAELLGEETVLVDATLGPAALADGLAAAAESLGVDLIVFVDVGGDALAHGDEPGLASPLCDALLLASGRASRRAGRGRPPVLGGIFGIGCDGELTPAEVLERLAEVGAAGGLAGRPRADPRRRRSGSRRRSRSCPPRPALRHCAASAARSAPAAIRQGRRTVELSPAGALTFYFDPGRGRSLRRPPGGRRDRRARPGPRQRDPARARRLHRARLRA